MIWIRFDESDHRIPAPFFCLPGVISGQANGQICIQDYHEQGSLALFFTHGSGCSACLQALQTFARRQEDYREQETKILAVFPETPEKLAENSDLARLPFPLLCDPANKARQAFTGLMAEGLVPQDASLLFVLDRYHAPYAALIGSEIGEQTGSNPAAAADIFTRDDVQEDILSWFRFIGIQCPE